MHISLRQLRAFIAAVETGGFTRAAHRLHLTQSAVSMVIRQLEADGLVVHLPLIIPENCRYRVGFEHRRWQEGKVLVFDDTIEHEARNDSDLLRVVLIFDVWNPLLSKAERDMVNAATSAVNAFYAAE